MREYDTCMGCEYYNNPYWSIVSPCKSCPRIYGIDGYVTTTTTNIKVEKYNDIAIATTPEYFAKIAEDEMNVEKATNFLKKLGIQVKTEYGNYRPTYDVLKDIGDAMSRT